MNVLVPLVLRTNYLLIISCFIGRFKLPEYKVNFAELWHCSDSLWLLTATFPVGAFMWAARSGTGDGLCQEFLLFSPNQCHSTIAQHSPIRSDSCYNIMDLQIMGLICI